MVASRTPGCFRSCASKRAPSPDTISNRRAPAGVTLAPGQLDLKESLRPLNLVVFADSDLLSDYLWMREQNFFGQRMTQAWASNGDLVQNALDNLAGSADLISVRGRASFTRPFERVDRLRRAGKIASRMRRNLVTTRAARTSSFGLTLVLRMSGETTRSL